MTFKTLKENKEIIILALVLIFLILTYVGIEGEKKRQQLEEIQKKESSYNIELAKIEAKSFYVYDIYENKTIFLKNEHEKLPLASITKLMTGLVVLDTLPESTIITIGANDVAQEGDTGLIVGEKWKLKDLLDFSLIVSSNDGMHALEAALNNYEKNNKKNTIDLMNEKAKSLGMNDTIFINSTGIDVDFFVSGAYSSSYDIATLFSYIVKNKPDLIAQTRNQSEKFLSLNNMVHIASNTNLSINNIPGILASKTGFTDLAGGNLGVIFDAGFSHPIVAVLLGSTESGRFTGMENLVKITLEKLSDSN